MCFVYFDSTCMCKICMYVYIAVGVYGDVVRVKILYNKRDSALVQFKEPQQIHTGMYAVMLYQNCYDVLHRNVKTSVV